MWSELQGCSLSQREIAASVSSLGGNVVVNVGHISSQLSGLCPEAGHGWYWWVLPCLILPSFCCVNGHPGIGNHWTHGCWSDWRVQLPNHLSDTICIHYLSWQFLFDKIAIFGKPWNPFEIGYLSVEAVILMYFHQRQTELREIMKSSLRFSVGGRSCVSSI